jgi:hypothetical protein
VAAAQARGVRLVKRIGPKEAKAAIARKLAIILHHGRRRTRQRGNAASVCDRRVLAPT